MSKKNSSTELDAKTAGRRWYPVGRLPRAMARYIRQQMKRPGFARQILNPTS